MKLRISILLVFAAAAVLPADETSPEALDELVDQLGDYGFELREKAERSLLERARLKRAETREFLEERFAKEGDPEVRHRLKAILRLVSSEIPLEETVFSAAGLEKRIWERNGDAPRKARYTLKDGLLEYESLDEVTDAMMFVHRFGGQKEGGLRFGPPPKPEIERLVLDAEIRVLKEHHIRPGLAGVHLNVEDHRSSAGLLIQEGGIFLYRDKRIHRMDTTDRWHHYRFVVEGDKQWIFVDDMERPVRELARPTETGRYWASFGDCTAGGGAHAQIRNVSFSRFAAGGNGKK